MKLGILSIGTALAGTVLLAAVAWPAQDAAGAKPGAAKPAQGAKQQAKPQTKPAAKPQPAPATEPAEDPAAAPAAEGKPGNEDAMMATRFAKAAKLTAQHEWLATFVGKWKLVSTYTIMPSKPKVESTGSSEFKMLMDGRFLVESRDANGGAGPFKGMGVIGFNSITGKAERVWFDTSSTAMVKSEGELNVEHNEIRWVDTWTDPLKVGVTTTTSVLTKQSDSEFTFQQINEFHGQTFMTLVVKYRKA